jgi:transcriptional regulator with XRE-family HTH domain
LFQVLAGHPKRRQEAFTLVREMDTRREIRDFLTSRRARITPGEVGLPTYGTRRVPGLRREEVATLAGVSVDYYNRMERGNLGGASESVLDALARALRLDEAERAHLYDLARASQPSSRPRRRSTKQNVRPSLQWMLDSMTGSAAIAENGRLDALATNRLGRAFYSHLFDGSGRPVNFARYVFLDPAAKEFFADWERAAKDVAALLRSEAGRNPLDRDLSDLVGELSTQSEEFRGHWATHNVRLHNKGERRLSRPNRIRCTTGRIHVQLTASWSEPLHVQPDPLTQAAALGRPESASDGTRTRDLRRDRPAL